MRKSKRLSEQPKKERKRIYEEIKNKGVRMFLVLSSGEFKPFCILCDRTLEHERHIMGIWVWEKLKRTYHYAVCEECAPKLGDNEVTERIEERLMLIASTRPKFKAKRK